MLSLLVALPWCNMQVNKGNQKSAAAGGATAAQGSAGGHSVSY